MGPEIMEAKSMKKRIFPVLLSFVLLCSLVTTAFAKPMTLVLEATGDTDKEFVLYIETDRVYADSTQANVEKVEIMWDKCNCGFWLFSTQQNSKEIWRNHKLHCRYRYIYFTETFYKITLKSGEKIAINTIKSNPFIFMEQEAGYPISYSTDGVNFTDYVNDPNIALAETGMAAIKFDSIENGTLTIRRTEPVPGAEPAVQPTPPDQPGPVESVQPVQPPASTATATPTNDALWVDGQLRNATVYKINDSNYFKIRDLAAVLNGTGKQFSVGYDAASKSVTATTGYAYQAVGGELSGAASGSQTAAVSNDTVIVNGAVAQNVTVYKIDGSNYFKLRDLGSALGFAVDYEAGKGMIINTTAAACSHNWATRHVAEVGHDEPGVGVHQQLVFGCACGVTVVPEDDDGMKQWIQHQKTCDKDDEDYTTWYIDVPNGPYHVVDTPAHDETYCTICGAVQ